MARMKRPIVTDATAATPEELEAVVVYECLTRLPGSSNTEAAHLLGKLNTAIKSMRENRGEDDPVAEDIAATVTTLREARRSRGA